MFRLKRWSRQLGKQLAEQALVRIQAGRDAVQIDISGEKTYHYVLDIPVDHVDSVVDRLTRARASILRRLRPDTKTRRNYQYERIREHLSHRIEIAYYGDANDPENMAIECLDCDTVIVSENRFLVDEDDDGGT